MLCSVTLNLFSIFASLEASNKFSFFLAKLRCTAKMFAISIFQKISVKRLFSHYSLPTDTFIYNILLGYLTGFCKFGICCKWNRWPCKLPFHFGHLSNHSVPLRNLRIVSKSWLTKLQAMLRCPTFHFPFYCLSIPSPPSNKIPLSASFWFAHLPWKINKACVFPLIISLFAFFLFLSLALSHSISPSPLDAEEHGGDRGASETREHTVEHEESYVHSNSWKRLGYMENLMANSMPTR